MSRKIIVSCFCAAMLLGGCAQKEDILLLERKLHQQEQAMEALQADLGRTSQAMDTVRPGQADLWSEVQAMRVQLAQIQGTLEDMQIATDNIPELQSEVAAVRETATNAEAGLRQVAAELGIELEVYRNKPQTTTAPAVPAPAQQEQTPTAAPSPAATSSQPEASDTSAEPAKPEANADSATLTEPAPALPVATAPASSAEEVPQVDTAQALYDAAYKAFSERRYNAAQQMWKEFEETFPKHKLAANAAFWQGEALYQAQDYANAAITYQRVIEKYSKSNKHRSALLKQGLAFIRVGKENAGKIRLNDVIEKYPKSAEAKRAKAELKKLQ